MQRDGNPVQEPGDGSDAKRPPALIAPCSAALGVIGVPARRWTTKADLYQQLAEAKAFMDACPLDAVSLSACAQHAGLSVHHFLRLFREVHGITPHRYLSSRRICMARRLLEETTMSISEIALEAGFGSASDFGRMFRQETGISASKYRRHFGESGVQTN